MLTFERDIRHVVDFPCRDISGIRIALLAVKAANNIPSWQGVLHALARTLRARGAVVYCIEHEDGLIGRIYALKQLLIRRVLKRKYQRHREPTMLRAYGRYTAEMLKSLQIDIAISLKAIPMAAAETPVPIVLYNDAPFGALRDFYAEFTGLSAGSIRDGENAEHQAARRAVHSIYSSQWGADAASRMYGVPPERLSVIEMGANLEIAHSAQDVKSFIDERLSQHSWEFLWLGIDWARKGGVVAVEIIEELHRRGYPVHLTVAGVDPKSKIASDLVTYIPFLNKTAIAEKLRTTHFLLLPTTADCTPIVYNEANAFGVPVLSTDVGGIRTQIRPGRNGLLFAPEMPAVIWADAVTQYLRGRSCYRTFAQTTFAEYEARLNWDVAADRILPLLRNILKRDLDSKTTLSGLPSVGA